MIMALPVGEDDVDISRLQALEDLAGIIKMREAAQKCAVDLAPYIHAKKASSVALEKAAARKEQAPELVKIPTPQKVLDAFERAAAGLPPEPRQKL